MRTRIVKQCHVLMEATGQCDFNLFNNNNNYRTTIPIITNQRSRCYHAASIAL